MNVATLTMPADEARERLEEYKLGLVGREPTEEDRGIILGLQAHAKGKALIDLHQVFRACPPDKSGKLPALAVARAHWRWCWLRRWSMGYARFAQSRDAVVDRLRHRAWHQRIDLPESTLPEALRGARDYHQDHRAIVPLIPPNLRPTRALHRYCILFEAEWEPVPPTDPLLIRHLTGSLYVVLAAWDLTPLERAVLSGRLAERGS